MLDNYKKIFCFAFSHEMNLPLSKFMVVIHIENSESVEKDENSEKKNKEWGDLCDDQNQKQQSWESRGADELSSQQQEDKNDYRIEQRDKKSE